jgi:hypothetical protein
MMRQLDGQDDLDPFPVVLNIKRLNEASNSSQNDDLDFLNKNVQHKMQFNVVINRKGEKVLSINGFKSFENDGLEGYGSEDDEDKNQKEEDDNTLFINLNRLLN